MDSSIRKRKATSDIDCRPPKRRCLPATPLDTAVQRLPQELQDMILECLLEYDSLKEIRLDRTFQTPLALRLHRKSRKMHAETYFGSSLFVVPATDTGTVLHWFRPLIPKVFQNLTSFHKQCIREIGLEKSRDELQEGLKRTGASPWLIKDLAESWAAWLTREMAKHFGDCGEIKLRVMYPIPPRNRKVNQGDVIDTSWSSVGSAWYSRLGGRQRS